MTGSRSWPSHADGLAWAAAALGADVVDAARLAGGLTSTMLALTDESGGRSVLRLMTEEPWRAHGEELVTREQATLRALAATPVPAPETIALDATGRATGVAAHLMTLVPGLPSPTPTDRTLEAMAAALVLVHEVLARFADRTSEPADAYWLVLDAVGFLPPPGRPPMFGSAGQLSRLDAWLHELVADR